jgi:hypothetical protein
LPRQCRVPPVRVPGQDFHLRSQHPYLAHPPRGYAARLRDDGRSPQHPGRNMAATGENRRPTAAAHPPTGGSVFDRRKGVSFRPALTHF